MLGGLCLNAANPVIDWQLQERKLNLGKIVRNQHKPGRNRVPMTAVEAARCGKIWQLPDLQ